MDDFLPRPAETTLEDPWKEEIPEIRDVEGPEMGDQTRASVRVRSRTDFERRRDDEDDDGA